ncbi:hypothetical protein [Streptomyces sp. N35]|uniref:hypothetical protein n=1 Tax=Streptomyces sp. N35 TaxID=2795730 RepID=UPI0018F65EF9|nr:hypothetical protein [Streptomyces sp. N35]
MPTDALSRDLDPTAPALIITDRPDGDPVGLGACPVPRIHRTAEQFSAKEYQRAPLVLLDDRSYTAFTLRAMPRRRGLILVLVDQDDASIWTRTVAVGGDAVVTAVADPAWLHLRLHEATDRRHADWEELLADGPADPPQPASG